MVLGKKRAHTGVDHGDKYHKPRSVDAFTEGQHREGGITIARPKGVPWVGLECAGALQTRTL